jgi:predicted RNA methylase/predicted Ser/Thr protein kinase
LETGCSPLAQRYREQEARWRALRAARYLGARLLRWGPDHRVFQCGSRVVKIEWAKAANDDYRRTLAYEFSLLEKLEGGASQLNPTYHVLDDAWLVLEMDWVEGRYVEDLIRQGLGREVSIARLLTVLFKASLAGVVYKQFRSRHIIQRPNGDMAFIDFGHSTLAHPLVALWRNFALLRIENGGWQWGRLVGVLRELRRRRDGVPNTAKAGSSGLQRWKVNARRPEFARAEHLAVTPGDPVAARHFAAMEHCLGDLIATEPQLCDELIEFHFAGYGIAANHDWGFLWDHIATAVDFAGKRVVDLGCGMGAVGVFARLAGGAGVTAFDSVPLFLEAARHFADALRITGNDYRAMDWAALTNGTMEPPGGDIVTILSARIDDIPLVRAVEFLSHYPEIIWRTGHAEAARESLAARGYRTIKTVMSDPDGGHIIYATDKTAP